MPDAPHIVYPRNFTKTVVCELRIPTLLEIDPAKQKAASLGLKKRFPLQGPVTEFKVTPNLGSAAEAHQVFKTRDGLTRAALRKNAIVLETERYQSFEIFQSDLNLVLGAMMDIIDTDFFTRVGLRYINEIPAVTKEIGDLVNPMLAASVSESALGRLSKAITEVRGLQRLRGEYALRYGIPPLEGRTTPVYLIDLDFFEANVDLSDLSEVLVSSQRQAHSLFEWCIGDGTRRYMKMTSESRS